MIAAFSGGTGERSLAAGDASPAPTHTQDAAAVSAFLGDVTEQCLRLERPLERLRDSKKQKHFEERLKRLTEIETIVLFRLRDLEPPARWVGGFKRYVEGLSRYDDRGDAVFNARSLGNLYPSFVNYAKQGIRLQGVRLATGIPDECPPDPFGNPYRQLFTARKRRLFPHRGADRGPTRPRDDRFPAEAISFTDRAAVSRHRLPARSSARSRISSRSLGPIEPQRCMETCPRHSRG